MSTKSTEVLFSKKSKPTFKLDPLITTRGYTQFFYDQDDSEKLEAQLAAEATAKKIAEATAKKIAEASAKKTAEEAAKAQPEDEPLTPTTETYVDMDPPKTEENKKGKEAKKPA